MKKVFYQGDNVELYLDETPFASGGEGDLHRVRRPSKYANYVVKIYHKDKRTTLREQKVKYMISNPPVGYRPNVFFPVVWPLGTVYERNDFLGFLMPLAKGEKLQVLSVPRLPKKLMQKWGRFDFSAPNAINLRLKICFNIATAIRQLHETNHYVLVDLKTDNIIIKENGFISIVDMDSVQVIDNGNVLFPATVTTPEYTPSEYYTRNVQPKKVPIPESWDLFSMTIIFYKLLFGIHPFAASAKPPYEKLTSLHQKIEAGLFVHSKSKTAYFQVIPPPHRKFSSINPIIQALFLECFENGHDNPDARPDADEWCWAITPSAQYWVDRKLPSKEIEIPKITYTKPLNTIITNNKILPVIAPKDLPLVPTAKFLPVHLKTPRRIAKVAITVFVIWMFFSSFSFPINSFIQFLVFVGSSTGMLYAYFRELPVAKRKRLVANQLSDLRNERSKKGRELDKIKQRITALPDKQQQIAKNFEQQQQQNLIQEKKIIETHILELRKYISEQDKMARELLKTEMTEIVDLQKKYFGTIHKDFKRLSRMSIEEQINYLEKEKKNAEQRLKQHYKQKITSISTDKERQVMIKKEHLQKQFQENVQPIESKIKSLKVKLNQEKVALQKHYQIRNQEQLRTYNIRDYLDEIFTVPQPLSNVICDYLERNNIWTAADFMDVGLEGKVKKTSSKRYEKIPFITQERGKELMLWKNSLEQMFNKKATISNESLAKLKEKYDLTSLEEQINQLKTKLAKELSLLNQNDDVNTEKEHLIQQFEKEVHSSNEKIEKAIITLRENKDAYEASKKAITEKYKAKHDVFEEKIRTFVADVLSQIKMINDKISSKNQELLNETMELTKKHTSEKAIMAMTSVNEQINIFNDLEVKFQKMKAEKEAYKDISFEQFLKKLVNLK